MPIDANVLRHARWAIDAPNNGWADKYWALKYADALIDADAEISRLVALVEGTDE